MQNNLHFGHLGPLVFKQCSYITFINHRMQTLHISSLQIITFLHFDTSCHKVSLHPCKTCFVWCVFSAFLDEGMDRLQIEVTRTGLHSITNKHLVVSEGAVSVTFIFIYLNLRIL